MKLPNDVQVFIECPACHCAEIKRILYGRPGPSAMEEIERGEAISGGCFAFAGQPDWQCAACRHRWFDADDPGKQEIEAFLRRIQERSGTKGSA